MESQAFSANPKQRGFTLLEILVAFSIFGIAAAGLSLVSSMSSSGNTTSKDRAAALALAIDKLEELKNQGYDRLTPGSDSDPEPISAGEAASAAALFTRSWTVSGGIFNGFPGKEIRVTVGWSGGRSATLATVLAEMPRDGAGRPSAFVTGWNQVR